MNTSLFILILYEISVTSVGLLFYNRKEKEYIFNLHLQTAQLSI